MAQEFLYPTQPTFELFKSTARTADETSAAQLNRNFRGILVVVDISVYPAAASVVPTLRYRDPITGKQVTLLAATALTATGTTVYLIGPDAASGEGITAAVKTPLPRDWDLFMDHADADSITYQVSAQYLP